MCLLRACIYFLISVQKSLFKNCHCTPCVCLNFPIQTFIRCFYQPLWCLSYCVLSYTGTIPNLPFCRSWLRTLWACAWTERCITAWSAPPPLWQGWQTLKQQHSSWLRPRWGTHWARWTLQNCSLTESPSHITWRYDTHLGSPLAWKLELK